MKVTVIQYRVVRESKDILKNTLAFERYLDSLGEEQWELCGMIDFEDKIVMTFKNETEKICDAYYS